MDRRGLNSQFLILNFEFLPAKFQTAKTPRTQSPPRSLNHRDTEAQRAHRAIANCPQITQITQMAVLKTRACGEAPAVVEQRPGTAEPDNRFGRKRPSRCHGPAAFALEERRPRHSSAPGGGWRTPPLPSRRGARRNRRAPGASSGGQPGCDERSRSEQSGFPPVVGDRLIADCSAVNHRHCRITSVMNSLRPLRLCGSNIWTREWCRLAS